MKRGFSRREASVYIGRSYSWLAKMAMRGTDDAGSSGPRFGKHGRSVVYLKEDLDRWLEQALLPASSGDGAASGFGTEADGCVSGALA